MNKVTFLTLNYMLNNDDTLWFLAFSHDYKK